MSDARADGDVKTWAQALLGSDVSMQRHVGGRNSRVYRIAGGDAVYALKVYPADGRNRAEREYRAATFLWAQGVRNIARPVAGDAAGRYGVYAWLDGKPIGRPDLADVEQLFDFTARVHALRDAPDAHVFSDATEACFDEHAVLAQVERRFERLAAIQTEAGLQQFLFGAFVPVLARVRARPPTDVHPAPRQARRTLSASDFGFHNALRLSPTQIAFLDFEYFGWDDPIKLVSDVCWHPGMALTPALRARFIERCADLYRADAAFEQRLTGAYPLFGLRWCLIVLNEFIPAMWSRRVAAGVDASRANARRDQLAKAYALLERVTACLEEKSV